MSMTKRALSSAIIVAVLFAAYKCGVRGLVFLIIVIGTMTQVEFYALLKKMGQRPLVATGEICGIFLMLATYFSAHGTGNARFNSILAPQLATHLTLAIATVASVVLLSRSLERVKKCMISTAIGVLYVPFMCCFPIAFLAKDVTDARRMAMIFYAAAAAKACDIGAMFAGKYFGKRKLAPDFSPNKTIEGVIGGILCANVVGHIAFVYPAHQLYWMKNTLLAMCYSTLLAVMALAGDLTESAIKRLADEKDSGKILPGIGGIFDLTDSLLFAIPIHLMALTLAPHGFFLCQ
jgi:phosphatidate cytidylyltransferase